VPVIDIYARISRALNGETIKVDDQIEKGAAISADDAGGTY
jgi:hypothetical protein